MSDDYLRGVLVLVAIMGCGVVLGVVSRRIRLLRTVIVYGALVELLVVISGWRYLPARKTPLTLVSWFLEGNLWNACVFAAILGLPALVACIATRWVMTWHSTRTSQAH